MLVLALLDPKTGEAVPVTNGILRALGYTTKTETEFYRDMVAEIQVALEKALYVPHEVRTILEVFNYDTDTRTASDSGAAETDLRVESTGILPRFGLLG